MGAFNALLSGLASKAGSNFKDLADEKRKRQEQQDDLVSASILKELQTNDQLDQSSHEALSREYYKRMGVPNAAADQLVAAHNHIFDNYNARQKSQQQAKDAATQAAPPLQSPDQTSAPTPTDLGPMPGQQLPQTAALPNIPPPPFQPGNPSIGDVKFAQSEPQFAKHEADQYTAQRNAQSSMTKQEFQDKLDILKGIDTDTTLSDAEKDERRRIVGALPKSAGTLGTLSKPVTGVDMKALLGSETFPDGRAIDPDKEYVAIKTGNKITDGHEYVPPSVGHAIQQQPDGTFDELQVDRTGKELGRTKGVLPPAGYAPVTVNGQRQEWVDFGDHKELKTIYSGSTRTRGVPPAPGTPPPAGPTSGPVGSPAPNVAAPNPGAPAPMVAPQNAQVARPMPGPPVPRTASSAGTSLASEPKGLSPKTKMDTIVGVNATDRAITPMQRMLGNLDVLDNPAVAAAIHFQADPNTGNLVSYVSGHAIDNNPRAQQFAADVIAATEDINKIRGAFGATAFRGHDAFQAMISQAGAGRLLVNKGVLKDTLTKTIGDLQTMRDEQAKFAGVPTRYDGAVSAGGSDAGAPPTKSLDDIFKKK